LAVPRPQSNGPNGGAQPVHLLVDSTGLKLCGAGERLLEKYGSKVRRAWRKLHFGVDAETGRVVASALTSKEADDGAQTSTLLDQITDPVASVTGDGASDQDAVYAAVAERHPDAAVMVPPRTTAVPSGTADTAPPQRDSPPPEYRRKRSHDLAASLWLQRARQGRGGNRALEAGDRR
jgi:hypothetical protein